MTPPASNAAPTAKNTDEVINVTTGANFITDGAFSNAGGVPMVVQNTGNNVLIQNSTILNIQVK